MWLLLKNGHPTRFEFVLTTAPEQVIDFQVVLEGELFGPLRDASLFDKVRIDPEVHTLVWPNGADWDPATLHDWPEHRPELQRMARRWSLPEMKN